MDLEGHEEQHRIRKIEVKRRVGGRTGCSKGTELKLSSVGKEEVHRWGP